MQIYLLTRWWKLNYFFYCYLVWWIQSIKITRFIQITHCVLNFTFYPFLLTLLLINLQLLYIILSRQTLIRFHFLHFLHWFQHLHKMILNHVYQVFTIYIFCTFYRIFWKFYSSLIEILLHLYINRITILKTNR